MSNVNLQADYLFETSWEVCNKISGIHTVLATKAPYFSELCKNKLIMIGPDVWREKNNHEFIEDRDLYSVWHEQAEQDGLHFRIGHWNIESKPIVILIDYSSFISQKDEIFKALWESHKLDSISGQWDYTEPAIFGYVASKVIEHFYQYNVMPNERVLAHFHEWLTGTGVLYLKKQKQIATAFTTHATVIGSCIAAKGFPLYKDMSSFNADELSQTFQVRAKYSLERLAAENADVFTTVSDIADKQCEYFLHKKVDKITENGLPDFLNNEQERLEMKKKSRAKLVEVGEALLNQKINDDALFLLHSGHYEFKNKGIDVFIDTLGRIKSARQLQKQLIAVIAVPAANEGARNSVKERIGHPDFNNPISGDYATHQLTDHINDQIIRRLQSNDIFNQKDDLVKVIFIPATFNGHDGLFSCSYSDLLQAFDATAYPVYYESWGYSAMESTAYKIPTLTTSLSGFGQWTKKTSGDKHIGVEIIERTDDNVQDVIDAGADWIVKLSGMGADEYMNLCQNAFDIAQSGNWKNLIGNYAEAHKVAFEKAELRSESYTHIPLPFNYGIEYGRKKAKPEWKKILINPVIPERLYKLHELSQNLWWSWDYEATEFFESINPELWQKLERNPIALIDTLNTTAFKKLEEDTVFMEKLDRIHARFKDYMNEKNPEQTPKVAYFSMEFGLHESVKIYSGGLGILAGDYLKEASDSNYNMIGIGLLYRYGYFKQQISINGQQIAHSVAQRFAQLPLQAARDKDGNWIHISISFPGRTIHAKVWRLDVGRVPLFLLDTDIENNNEQDRAITHHLYGGDIEHRLKQEILLGVGGIRAIRHLGENPDLYHCNEGHAAFIGLERLKVMIEEEGKSFVHAKELVRASTLFTTHTPVPAGHDAFSEDLMRIYISHYPKRLGITWDVLMGLGRVHEDDNQEKFSMSILATKLSQEMNGVSRIHGKVSQEMFANMFEGYEPKELYIGYVTNGVHYKTWANALWQKLHDKYFGSEYINDMSNPSYWKGIMQASDEEIWSIRTTLRQKLITLAKAKLQEDMTVREENPNTTIKMLEGFDENKLTIGFARRFATYKRAHLLFTNPQRLSEIVNHPTQPVQFIFAGKAHPADKAGQDLIKLILDYSRQPEFQGKIFFLENYDIEIAKHMVQGVDIWMNTPTRPLEASGTSGEKAVMNGVLNLSVLDGWWAEGYKENAGWALKEERTYQNQAFQDALDAETIYNLIEHEIAPVFYDRDEAGISKKWIELIRKNFTDISPYFTMKRQLDDYINKYYVPLFKRSSMLLEKNGQKAHELARWKVKVANAWEHLEIIDLKYPDATQKPLQMGDNFEAELTIDLKELKPEDIGIEFVFGQKNDEQVEIIKGVRPLEFVRAEGAIATYRIDMQTALSGVFDFTFRIYPTNPLLPHRQDFNLIKWA